MIIMSAQTVDGSGADFEYTGHRQAGHMNLYVSGNLGGGTLTLEAKLPDGSGYAVIQTVGAGVTIIEASPIKCRLTLTGSTTPNVSAWAEFDSSFARDAVRAR